MPRWVVVVQSGYGESYSLDEVEHIEDTLERARARLYELACTHRPRTGLRQKSRKVYRIGDGYEYFVTVEGKISTHHVLYRLAELAWSTDTEPNPWQ
ncbi:hypothetical protein HLK59_21045 [Streptomyces sp. S3(2020)]|uniref:hypothetical protein n=1 Tax=Streptomyces sp. S3(2020) TaxID=2732044 RepID=UPI0014876ED7|nr:hypothetical protein [Streptomyces sp. S3(2020)]NNN32805.1 hypothetical protein [Streptomyces sp. S3(2020)]